MSSDGGRSRKEPAGKGTQDKGRLGKALGGLIALATVARGVKGRRSGDHPPPREAQTDTPDPAKSPDPADPRSPATTTSSEKATAKKPNRLVKQIDDYQRTHAWLGFPFGVAKKFGEDQAGNLAALISYYTFFSIFPLMLALVTVLGFVLDGDPEMQRTIVDSALAEFPVLGDQIRSNIGSLSGSGLALIVGLAGALWAGMAAVDAAQNAMNSVWDVPVREQPKFLPRRLRSLLMLVVVGGGLLVTTVAATGAGAAGTGLLAQLAGLVASTAVNVGVFAVAFRILTGRHLTWSEVLPGAVVAGVIAGLLQLFGGYYIDHTLQGASQTYGTFAVVIGLLSWIYLQAQMTLFAAEVNVVRARQLWPRSLVTDPDDLTEGDRRALEQHAEMEERVPDQDVRTAIPGETGERGVDRPTGGRDAAPAG